MKRETAYRQKKKRKNVITKIKLRRIITDEERNGTCVKRTKATWIKYDLENTINLIMNI